MSVTGFNRARRMMNAKAEEKPVIQKSVAEEKPSVADISVESKPTEETVVKPRTKARKAVKESE